MWYYIDPDYRRNAPKDKPYCECCQREIKDVNKAIRVTLSEDFLNARQDDKGENFIGADCWKKITHG